MRYTYERVIMKCMELLPPKDCKHSVEGLEQGCGRSSVIRQTQPGGKKGDSRHGLHLTAGHNNVIDSLRSMFFERVAIIDIAKSEQSYLSVMEI